jgi:hypothetical protein
MGVLDLLLMSGCILIFGAILVLAVVLPLAILKMIFMAKEEGGQPISSRMDDEYSELAGSENSAVMDAEDEGEE